MRGLGLETLKMLVAASRGTGVVPMVRVPRGEYHFIARALDVGAQGIMVPMVESVGAGPRHRPVGALSQAGPARCGLRLRA